jgi:hypothetical protein
LNDTHWRGPRAYDEAMFAHQGGWDEFLFVAIPIALIFGLLRLANSRAKKLQAAASSAPDESE